MSVESDDSRSIPSFSLSPSKKYTGAAHSTSSFMTERVISSKQGASDGDDQLLVSDHPSNDMHCMRIHIYSRLS